MSPEFVARRRGSRRSPCGVHGRTGRPGRGRSRARRNGWSRWNASRPRASAVGLTAITAWQRSRLRRRASELPGAKFDDRVPDPEVEDVEHEGGPVEHRRGVAHVAERLVEDVLSRRGLGHDGLPLLLGRPVELLVVPQKLGLRVREARHSRRGPSPSRGERCRRQVEVPQRVTDATAARAAAQEPTGRRHSRILAYGDRAAFGTPLEVRHPTDGPRDHFAPRPLDPVSWRHSCKDRKSVKGERPGTGAVPTVSATVEVEVFKATPDRRRHQESVVEV